MMAEVNPIRWYRKQQDLRAEGLAEKAGLSAQSVWKIEKGTTAPRIDTLYRLAEALRVDPISLIAAYQRWSEDTKLPASELIKSIAPKPETYAEMVEAIDG
jgi:transcriptional regulator with XRE-family HTH domain